MIKIVSSSEIVHDAWQHRYAVAAINCQGGNYDIVRAVIEAAQEEQAPVILAAYAGNTEYYGLAWLPKVVEALKEEFEATVAVHLDHGLDVSVVEQAVDSGYTSVMIDYSKEALDDNVAACRRVIEAARPKGVSVEAELGELHRNDRSGPRSAAENLVDPDDVQYLLQNAPVDMLAVGIGNAHGFYKGTPNIRLDLLEQVREVSADTPLVLHGTTGIPEKTVSACIAAGMAKVNFGTAIRVGFLRHLKAAIEDEEICRGHAWRACRYASAKTKDDIKRLLRLVGSSGRL